MAHFKGDFFHGDTVLWEEVTGFVRATGAVRGESRIACDQMGAQRPWGLDDNQTTLF